MVAAVSKETKEHPTIIAEEKQSWGGRDSCNSWKEGGCSSIYERNSTHCHISPNNNQIAHSSLQSLWFWHKSKSILHGIFLFLVCSTTRNSNAPDKYCEAAWWWGCTRSILHYRATGCNYNTTRMTDIQQLISHFRIQWKKYWFSERLVHVWYSFCIGTWLNISSSRLTDRITKSTHNPPWIGPRIQPSRHQHGSCECIDITIVFLHEVQKMDMCLYLVYNAILLWRRGSSEIGSHSWKWVTKIAGTSFVEITFSILYCSDNKVLYLFKL